MMYWIPGYTLPRCEACEKPFTLNVKTCTGHDGKIYCNPCYNVAFLGHDWCPYCATDGILTQDKGIVDGKQCPLCKGAGTLEEITIRRRK